MSLPGNDATGSAGHTRGAADGRDVAGKLYAVRVTTGVVTVSALKTEDLTPRPGTRRLGIQRAAGATSVLLFNLEGGFKVKT